MTDTSSSSFAVAMDEAGNTGENLLDGEQPVYALAAVRTDLAAVSQPIADALARTRMPELKFNKLRSSNRGRRNVIALLADLDLDPNSVAIVVFHKPWMVAAKLVDELIEPTMLARGDQMRWYASGGAKAMAVTLYKDGPRALGEQLQELSAAFQSMVRRFDGDKARSFLKALTRARLVCRDPDVSAVLAEMLDDEAGLRSEFADRPPDTLDPALPALFWQGGHWSAVLDEPFDIVHDDSNTVARWASYLELAKDGRDPSRLSSFQIGQIQIDLPVHVRSIDFGQSHRDDRLQVADILAGAGAHLYSVATGARRPDEFARALQTAGIGNLLAHDVGPEPDAKAMGFLRR